MEIKAALYASDHLSVARHRIKAARKLIDMGTDLEYEMSKSLISLEKLMVELDMVIDEMGKS